MGADTWDRHAVAVLSGTEERSTWRFRVWGFRVGRLGFRGYYVS